MSGLTELVKEYLHGNRIDSKSTYEDSTGNQITSAQEYCVAEILISGGKCYVYKYALIDGDGNPTETNGRTKIVEFAANSVKTSMLAININRATSGIYPRLSNTKILRLWAEKYETEEEAFKLCTDVKKRTKGTDTLESDPPTDGDKSSIIWLQPLFTTTKILIKFRTDETLSSDVEIDFNFTVHRTS